MKIIIASVLLAACAARQPVSVTTNTAETYATAAAPDAPHGAVGDQMAFVVDTGSQALLVCWSTDHKHTECRAVSSWAPPKQAGAAPAPTPAPPPPPPPQVHQPEPAPAPKH